MIVLDITIVNVALPSIQSDLGFSQSNLAWVVNAYLIPFGGLLLLAGRVGDLVGQRRVFLTGLAVFTGASVLCALTEAINWHWIFFINLPIGVATALFALRLIEARDGIGLGEGADILGAVLITTGLMLGVYTILEVEQQGWGSTQTLALGGVSLTLLAAFIARQARIANPLMPLRLFRSRNVGGAQLVQALTVVGMFGLFFLGALYLQRILGYSPFEVGLAFLPATIVMAAMSFRFTARLNMRFGAKATLLPGMGCILAAMLLFALTPVDATYAIDLLPAMIVFGLGAGLAFPSLMTLAMSGATRSDSGLASGLVNTSVQVGGAIGLAVLATFATERTDGLLADGESTASALNSGYHLAYLIGAGLVLVAIAIAVSVLRARLPEAPAEAVAEAAAEAVERPLIHARPLPNYILGGGCEETGMRVVIGCGGCTATTT